MRNNPTVVLLVVVGVVLTLSLGSAAQSRKRTNPTTVLGYISDSSCGLIHMEGMSDEASCTLMCVKGSSSFVLADQDHKKVYHFDKTGQEKAGEFAGRRVKVIARVSGETIRVTSIEALT